MIANLLMMPSPLYHMTDRPEGMILGIASSLLITPRLAIRYGCGMNTKKWQCQGYIQ